MTVNSSKTRIDQVPRYDLGVLLGRSESYKDPLAEILEIVRENSSFAESALHRFDIAEVDILPCQRVGDRR
jgi:hypothetical protein